MPLYHRTPDYPTHRIVAPTTPGAAPVAQSTHMSLREARIVARLEWGWRKDLRGQDVRIERYLPDGRAFERAEFVEYAGPCR